MAVVGFSIHKIEGERKKPPSGGKVNISNTPKIISVENEEVKLNEKQKDKALRLEFQFNSNFEPKIGSITLTGNIVYMHPESEEIAKKWKKDKTLPAGITVDIMNFIFRRCIVRALSIGEDLQLPPLIPFPVAKVESKTEQKESEYIK